MKEIKIYTDEFLWHCEYEKGLSSQTLKAYSLDLKQFLRFLSTKNELYHFKQIDKVVIREYIQILTSNNKVKTVKRKIASLKACFNYLEFEERISLNPFHKMRVNIKEPFKLPTVMTISEVKKIFKVIYRARNRCKQGENHAYQAIVRDIAVLELLFITGIRVSELCNLKSKNIDINNGLVKINGKGNKERIIQICNPESKNALNEYKKLFLTPDKSNYFFLNRLNKRLSEQSVRYMIKRYVKETKLKTNITPHVFRHTFATTLLEADVDIKYIQHLLGHSSIMTTQIYTHVSKKKLRHILLTKHPRRSFSTDDF